jgi:hypothetical protein
LRTLADISGKNVLIDPSLERTTVTANLDNIPYDQALEIIMGQVNAAMRVRNDIVLFGDRALLQKRDQDIADGGTGELTLRRWWPNLQAQLREAERTSRNFCWETGGSRTFFQLRAHGCRSGGAAGSSGGGAAAGRSTVSAGAVSPAAPRPEPKVLRAAACCTARGGNIVRPRRYQRRYLSATRHFAVIEAIREVITQRGHPAQAGHDRGPYR